MRAVDTNVVVRYVTRDHPAQFAAACVAMEQRAAWLSVTVVLEVEWVLRSVYRFPPSDVAHALRLVAGLPSVELEAPAELDLALRWHERGMEFADALHLARAAHCQGMDTFDRDFIKAAARIGLQTVAEP
jgi:predicted nucleic-acid-binding protein